MSQKNIPKTTAADFLQQLQEQRPPVEEIAAKPENFFQRESIAAPIVAELNLLGYKVASVDELRTLGIRYSSALPLLISWLYKLDDPIIKESVVRALSVPWAREAALHPILGEYIKCPASLSSLKWALANAIEILADESVSNELVRLAKNHEDGKAREMIVLALAKAKRQDARDLLVQLLEDDEVRGHAAIAISKMGVKQALSALKRHIDDPTTWIRREVRKAISRLERV